MIAGVPPSPMASIVVSIFRRERYIRRFARNVHRFARDLDAFPALRAELVVILNSPSTRERRVIGDLHTLGCPQLRFQMAVVPRETLYASWNRGIHLARGDALGFWNVDDCRYSSAVAEAIAGMRAGASLMYFPFVIDHRWRKWGFVPRRRRTPYPAVEFDRGAFQTTFRVGPFFMFARALYDAVGPFDEQFRISGDLDWCLRALRQTSFTPGSQVAGVFLNEHRGLSMAGSQRAIAEHNAIYVRHGLADLVQPVDGSLSAEYDARRVRVGSAWLEIPGFRGVTEAV